MPTIEYRPKRFGKASLAVIAQANAIIKEYADQGFTLTLRQLYYQFVSRDLIPNSLKSYKRLGGIVDDGRMSGLIDWEAIEDRTRRVHRNYHLESASHAIRDAADTFRLDLWTDQPKRVEVWIEKDALLGVIESTCRNLDVPFFACRGYSSQSAMWRSAMGARFNQKKRNQSTVILYMGDHDPSGIDMTRDVQERMELLSMYSDVTVERLALNRDQVDRYNPPPNPTKLTDARAEGYLAEHGNESWELDALDPKVINQLIQKAVKKHRDEKKWNARVALQEKYRERLVELADHEEELDQMDS